MEIPGFALTENWSEELSRRQKIQKEVAPYITINNRFSSTGKMTVYGTTSKQFTNEELVFGIDTAPFGGYVDCYTGDSFIVVLIND